MNRLILLIIVVGLLPFRVYAAGPMMHVVLGQKWLEHYAPNYSEEEKRQFLLGTVFPDIRYLGVIKRNKTHFIGVTLDKITLESSPFKRGMLFHSYVDEFREKFVRKSAITNRLKEIKQQQGTFLKLVEDEILRKEYDFNQFRIFLATIPDDEYSFGIDKESVAQWHGVLTLYFSTFPSFILAQVSLFEKGILTLDAPTVKTWSNEIPKYAQDPEMTEYVKNLFSQMDKNFTDYEQSMKIHK